jgi:hypothetical protein
MTKLVLKVVIDLDDEVDELDFMTKLPEAWKYHAELAEKNGYKHSIETVKLIMRKEP